MRLRLFVAILMIITLTSVMKVTSISIPYDIQVINFNTESIKAQKKLVKETRRDLRKDTSKSLYSRLIKWFIEDHSEELAQFASRSPLKQRFAHLYITSLI